jgi:hypothetical protein
MLAGALLPDGAIIASDCRVSWVSDKGVVHTDYAQKIVRLGEASALAYSGDIETFHYLLPHIARRVRLRRSDPVSLELWLPRFLRTTYRAMARYLAIGPLTVMVAGSLKGRPTSLPRARIHEMIEATHRLGVNNTLMFRCLRDFLARREPVRVPGSTQGVLYVMESPKFKPQFCPPLGVIAAGSGSDVLAHLRTYQPLIMCGPEEMSPHLFLDAIGAYLIKGESTVGGMLLVSHARNGRLQSLCFQQPDIDGPGVSIRQQGDRFIVREADGRETQLLYPHEILRNKPVRPIVFDGLRTILSKNREQFEGLEREVDRLMAGNEPAGV